jgi:Fuc2NAc and GlcNAc transferase
MLLISLIIVLSLLISFALTYFVRYMAIKRKLMDFPNDRSSHDTPVPRVGGIAITITWYASLSILYLFNHIDKSLYYALLCGLPIAIISFIDDIKSISAWFRLLIHFIAAISAFYFLGGLRQFLLFDTGFSYIYFIYPVFIIGMVWFINLFNFMDGIDGFASNESIAISLVLFAFSGNIVPLLLIACVSGFLYWNLSSKRIFLGDTGSTQLGFILIVLGLYFHNKFNLSILNWLMIAGPFWFDATYTLFLRWRNKEKLSEAHRKHAYQRLVQAGYSHKKVNLILIIINFGFFAMILLYRWFDILKVPLTAISIYILYYLYQKVNKMVPFK